MRPREIFVHKFENLEYRLYSEQNRRIWVKDIRSTVTIEVCDWRYRLPPLSMDALYPTEERIHVYRREELRRRSLRVQEEAAIRSDYYRRKLDELGERTNDLSAVCVSGSC